MTNAATCRAAAPTPRLLVATDLTVIEQPSMRPVAGDVLVDNRAYRPLDEAYYAWLRRRMDGARRAHEAGRLSAETWRDLRANFNVIHAWALAHLDPRGLLEAVEAPTPVGFRPPAVAGEPSAREGHALDVPPVSHAPHPAAAHRYPAHGDWRFTVDVPPVAVREVMRIHEAALEAGWREGELLQNRGRFRFPCGPDWGLVCFLHEDRRIGQVTAARIELLPRGGTGAVMGFYRMPRPRGSDTFRAAPVSIR